MKSPIPNILTKILPANMISSDPFRKDCVHTFPLKTENYAFSIFPTMHRGLTIPIDHLMKRFWLAVVIFPRKLVRNLVHWGESILKFVVRSPIWASH